MHTSIVIPNWNGKSLLGRNLPVLLESSRLTRHPVEVIVVDDGSRDGSPCFLRQEFPEVKQVIHPQNRGFSAACLSGVQAAQGEVVMLLNNDVIVADNLIDVLVSYFSRKDTFSVSPLVVDEDGANVAVSLRIPYLRRGKVKFRRFGEIPSSPCYTLFCSGGSVAYWREKFLQLGGFNPLYYPFYLEDRELGLRAWRRGWKSYLEPRVKVVHPAGGTIQTAFQRKLVNRIKKRNEILFTLNNLLDRRLLWANGILPLTFKLLYKWINLSSDYYWSFGAAMMRFPEIRRQRKQEKKSQILTETEIFGLISQPIPETF